MKKYQDWTSSDFISYITKLEARLKQVEHDESINFKWAGNLGHWTWFLKENKVIFNDLKASTLGYNPKDIADIGFEFFTSKLHPDDYDAVMDNMRNHLKGKSPAYEVEYRIRHKDGHYLWYYDRGVISKKDELGNPLILDGIVFNISEARQMEDKLRYYAEHDILTGVYNRRMLYMDLETLINKNNKTFSLVMIDIDEFKSINDTFGHLMGDDILVDFVEVIEKESKTSYRIYRYGGDEFFIILPNTTLAKSIEFSKNLIQSIRNYKFSHGLPVSGSLGIVEYDSKMSLDELINHADDLMYQAKKNGKNQYKF